MSDSSSYLRTQSAHLANAVAYLRSAIEHDDWASVCAQVGVVADILPGLASEAAVVAARNGLTQRRIADLLNVSPRALRGLVEAVAP